MKIFLLFLFFFLFIQGCSEDTPTNNPNPPVFVQKPFFHRIGGNSFEETKDIIQTSDGGFALSGTTSSFGFGGGDAYIVKLDRRGLLEWTRTVGGGSSTDYGNSIIQITGGGYVLAGSVGSFGAGRSDMYIVKLDASGPVIWGRTIGGSESEDAHDIIQASDGGYVIAGETESFGEGFSDAYIVKLDGSGSLLWTRTVGGTAYDIANSVKQTLDGGYIAAGYATSYGAGQSDFYAIKLDSSGNVQWTRTIGSSIGEICTSVINTNDTCYILAGHVLPFGSQKIQLVKLNNTGELIWSKILDVAPSIKCNSMIQTLDGGFALTGEISLDMLIVKLNAVCELEWIKTIPSADRGYSIIQTFDGGYVIGGNAFTDMCIIKFDGSGITCPLTNSHSGSISSGGTLDSGGVSGSGGIVGNGEIFDIGGSLIVVCTSN